MHIFLVLLDALMNLDENLTKIGLLSITRAMAIFRQTPANMSKKKQNKTSL